MTFLRQVRRGSRNDGGHSETGGGRESHLAKEFEELAHLLFEWPIRQAPRLALPACILAAAIIQAAMVILFSISYQSPSARLPSSPQIYFLPIDSPVAHAIAPWLEANDPGVFSPQYDTRDALPAPPPLSYRPSYEEAPPAMRPLRFDPLEAVTPPMIPLMTGILIRNPKAPKHETNGTSSHTVEIPPTVVHWQDALANRISLASPSVATVPQVSSNSEQPALYEVGISAEGIPMHCDLLESSGDPSADENGSVWIHAQRFQPTTHDSWGRVLILWGAAPRALTGKSAIPDSGSDSAPTP
jgi:hypothetical protein